jgi:hypothetical protein
LRMSRPTSSGIPMTIQMIGNVLTHVVGPSNLPWCLKSELQSKSLVGSDSVPFAFVLGHWNAYYVLIPLFTKDFCFDCER